MFHAESSASSPYSSRSTDASSPESADVKPNINGYASMNAIPAFFNHNGFAPTMRQTSPSHPPTSYTYDLSSLSREQQPIPSVATSTTSTHQGGTRSEPPKRTVEVDGLRVVTPRPDDLVRNTGMNRLLLQGDPQHISKQRVETAIRVILDILRLVPATPSDPPLEPGLLPLLLRDGNGNVVTNLERVGTFRSIKLQAGTTTKTASKKQLQAGPTPKEQLLYLETAVYMSGENGQRVYACRRCRMREAKRRQNKDASRKKPTSESESSAPASRPQRQSAAPPSPDYVTDANPEQYDPLRTTQQVEEPIWDPTIPDWRHEIVLFNSPPEVLVKDGSCVWLPFRVVCYGKCHGEKQGFKVKFTLRTHTGGIVATGITDPIRITDDHKTDAKVKGPKVDGMSSNAPRSRKSRASASVASSRRVSPAPSDAESVQSLSEAGAVVQKQAAPVRSKPYNRPSMSPLAPTGQLEQYTDKTVYRRTPSTTSLHSLSGLSLTNLNGNNDIMSQTMFDTPNGTVSPGVLRQPAFDFGYTSGQSSNVASPMAQPRTMDNDPTLFEVSSPNLMSAFNSLHTLEQRQADGIGYNPDQEMSNAMSNGLDNIFDTSSHASLASSYDSASAFSTNLPEGSLFSDSGLVPEDMQGFLDFTGGEGDSQIQQPFFDQRSPTSNPPLSPLSQSAQDRQVDDILAQLVQVQQNHVPVPLPPPNAPMISTVIPAEGPVAGGTTVAIIGANFTPGIVVMFGDRTAKLQRVDATFIQCMAPPAAAPGIVEVSIAGAIKMPGAPPSLFKYNMMDMDLMMLALQVKTQYGGASNDAAYRLAQQVAARSQVTTDWSDPSASNGQYTTHAASASVESSESDLQTKVIDFIASLDADAPGSMRSSGCINTRNDAQQTLLHIATVMGFHRLVRRLIVVGAHLDLQDLNGYTALGFACLLGQTNCARVLIEAGAAYDRPTGFGEMPLDLSKVGEHAEVEALLLSAVWSTQPDPASASTISGSASIDACSEIDEDNPSDQSDDDARPLGMTKPRRPSRKVQGKQRSAARPVPTRSRRASLSEVSTAILPPTPMDDPPPYEHVNTESATMMSRTPSGSTIKLPVPDLLWDRLPLPLHKLLADGKEDGWVAIPAPSWDTLTKMTNPEEVKLFTQAMAAAALNAVVQSGATTSAGRITGTGIGTPTSRKSRRRIRDASRDSYSSGSGSGTSSPRRRKLAEQVKSGLRDDRMLYLFWLPILLFVGFWLMVTALPIATGFCLIYARQITRAIKQRI